jgi:flagellar protein FliS
MNPGSHGQKYLKTQISTASPEQLLLMLYDGAIRFLHQAHQAIEKDDINERHKYLIRAQRIMIELICSLNREVDKELCENLTSLYYYIYRLLIDINLDKNLDKLNEAISLLDTLRSGWREAVTSFRQEKFKPTGTSSARPETGGSGLSLQG